MPRHISISYEIGDTKISIATEDEKPFGYPLATYLKDSPDTCRIVESSIELAEGVALNVFFYEPVTDIQQLEPLVRAIKAAMHQRGLRFNFEQIDGDDVMRPPLIMDTPRAGALATA